MIQGISHRDKDYYPTPYHWPKTEWLQFCTIIFKKSKIGLSSTSQTVYNIYLSIISGPDFPGTVNETASVTSTDHGIWLRNPRNWPSEGTMIKKFIIVTSVSNLLLVRLVEHVKCTRKWVSRVSSVSNFVSLNNIFYIYLSRNF